MAAEVELAVPRRLAVIVQIKRHEQLRPLRCKIACKGGVVKIQKAGAETFRLAVDHIEHFHLFAFRQAKEAHEWKNEGEVVEMPQAMLAIYLRQYFHAVAGNRHACVGCLTALKPPRAVRALPCIERQRNRRAVFLLDVLAKIQTVRGIEAPLIPTPGVLIKDIGKTQ